LLTYRPRLLLLGTAVLAGMYTLSMVSYLLFHSVVELLSIVVMLCSFTLVWNFRRSVDNSFLLIAGASSLALSAVNLLHTLSYKGMGVFPQFDANLPTQLWIASRYLLALSLVAGPFFIHRRVRATVVTAIAGALAAGAIVAIFTGVFPACFVEGVGLTDFKVVSEYIIVGIMAVGLGLLYRRRRAFDPAMFRLLVAYIALSMASDLAFTFYISVYGFSNMVGHLVHLVSTYVLYLAVVESGLNRPVSTLFHNLKQSEEALKAERNFIAAVLENAGALLIVIDPEGRIVRFNRACEELTGYPATEVVGRHIWETVVPPEDVERSKLMVVRLRARQASPSGENNWLTRGGERRRILWNTSLISAEDGSVKYVVGSGVDVTEQRRVEQELADRERRLRVMVEAGKTGMLVVDRESRTIVDANPAAAELIGLEQGAIAGRRCTDFLECPSVDGTCHSDLDGTAHDTMKPVLKTASGQLIPIHRTTVPIVHNGRQQLLVSFVDMTEHRVIEEELRKLSLVDDLTGLHNRRGFLTLAQQEINVSLRLKRPMILLFIDLENLREIADQWGHVEGERALGAVAALIKEAFSETGLVARTGEAEFVVLAPQYAGVDASMLTSRLYQHLEMYNGALVGRYELRMSAGAARLNPDRPCTIADLLAQADAVLFAEKRRHQVERLRSART